MKLSVSSQSAALTRPVIVQRIVTSWTKTTRGAEGREARARMATAYALPDALLVSQRACLQHFVVRGEHDEWAVKEDHREDDEVSVAAGKDFGCSIRLAIAADELEISFVHGADCGAPPRHRKSACVRAGSWARVRFNGRFGGENVWYEEKMVNIAFRMVPTRDLFLVNPPSVVLDAMADLW